MKREFIINRSLYLTNHYARMIAEINAQKDFFRDYEEYLFTLLRFQLLHNIAVGIFVRNLTR